MLTSKKLSFIDNYKLTRNASDSARKAGYSLKCCRQIGSRLLTNVDVKTVIDAWEAEEHAKLENKREERTKETFVDTAWKEYEKDSNPPAVRVRALEVAGKALGHLNGEVSINNNTQINVSIDKLNVMSLDDRWDMARKLLL